MNEFTIHVKVSLEEASLSALGRVLTASVGGARPERPAVPAPVEIRQAPDPNTTTTASQELPVQSSTTVDNMTLNTAVKAAQERGASREEVIAVFDRYGIKAARYCPEDKRPGLLSDLNALHHA